MAQNDPIVKWVNGIGVFRYRSLASCLAAFFQCRPNEVPARGTWEWRDRKGRKVRSSMKQVLRLCRERGCWGWTANHKTLHLWIGRKASLSEAVGLIAHELGHREKPWSHGAREERKAARYEAVTQDAVDLLAVLRKKPRTKRKST